MSPSIETNLQHLTSSARDVTLETLQVQIDLLQELILHNRLCADAATDPAVASVHREIIVFAVQMIALYQRVLQIDHASREQDHAPVSRNVI